MEEMLKLQKLCVQTEKGKDTKVDSTNFTWKCKMTD